METKSIQQKLAVYILTGTDSTYKHECMFKEDLIHECIYTSSLLETIISLFLNKIKNKEKCC